MQAGQLRHRVLFQRSVTTLSDLGEPVKDWQRMAEVWARVEPIAGKERFSAMQVQADVDHRLTIRYHPALADLAPEDRALWGDQVFDIKSVLNSEGRNAQMEVFARRHI
jgi:SPP1 family predicted phage head-tail adaptor